MTFLTGNSFIGTYPDTPCCPCGLSKIPVAKDDFDARVGAIEGSVQKVLFFLLI